MIGSRCRATVGRGRKWTASDSRGRISIHHDGGELRVFSVVCRRRLSSMALPSGIRRSGQPHRSEASETRRREYVIAGEAPSGSLFGRRYWRSKVSPEMAVRAQWEMGAAVELTRE